MFVSELFRRWDNQGHQPAVWSQDRATEESPTQLRSQHQDVHSPRLPSTDWLRQAAGGGENWGKTWIFKRTFMLIFFSLISSLTDLGMFVLSGTGHSNGWPTWPSWTTRRSRPTWSSWTTWSPWGSHGSIQPRTIQPGTSRTTVSTVAICLTSTLKVFVITWMLRYRSCGMLMVIYFYFFTSGPPAPYQPQGWGNGYPHWQQGQPDPSEYLLLVGLKLKKALHGYPLCLIQIFHYCSVSLKSVTQTHLILYNGLLKLFIAFISAFVW